MVFHSDGIPWFGLMQKPPFDQAGDGSCKNTLYTRYGMFDLIEVRIQRVPAKMQYPLKLVAIHVVTAMKISFCKSIIRKIEFPESEQTE